MSIAVIGDPDTATGFRLGGVSNVYVAQDDVEDILRKLSADEKIGVIVLTEPLADANRQLIEEIKRTKKTVTPIFVEIPDKKGPVIREVDPLKMLIKSAIGVEI